MGRFGRSNEGGLLAQLRQAAIDPLVRQRSPGFIHPLGSSGGMAAAIETYLSHHGRRGAAWLAWHGRRLPGWKLTGRMKLHLPAGHEAPRWFALAVAAFAASPRWRVVSWKGRDGTKHCHVDWKQHGLWRKRWPKQQKKTH